MKHLLYKLSIVIFLAAFTSCSIIPLNSFNLKEPEGKIESKSLNLNNFNSISVNRGLNITYTFTTQKPYAEVSAPADLLPYIELSVKNNHLSCTTKTGCPFKNFSNKTKIHIYGPAINEVITSASSQIEFLNLLTTSQPLNLVASSSSSIILSAQVPVIDVTASSSASITLAATTNEISLAAATSANIRAAVKSSKSCDVTTSSSASIQLEGITNEANFTASSSGSISAKNLKADTGLATASSSGSINCSIAKPTSLHTSSSGSINNK